MALVLVAILLATLLIFCYLVGIWWLDRYEREPFFLVLLTFVYGAIGGTVLSCIFNSIAGASAVQAGASVEVSGMITAVLVAPVVEEFMKGLVFLMLLMAGNFIDNRTDGLIYGAAAGLGFSCVENLWYYITNFNADAPEQLLALIFVRTLFTALVHCVSSSLLGMSIGYARHRSGAFKWLLFPTLGYIAAVANHAAWNTLATSAQLFGSSVHIQGALALMGIALVGGAALMMFVLTQLSLHSEHKFIRKYLMEEARRGVLPIAHAEVIPYWLRRRRSGWLPAHIDQGAYIKAATLLAFRHWQLEVADGERRHQYMEDITRYRTQVQQLLGTSV